MNYHFYYPPLHKDNLIPRHKPISEEKQVLNFYLKNKDTDVKYQIYFSKMDLALFTKSQVSYFWYCTFFMIWRVSQNLHINYPFAV